MNGYRKINSSLSLSVLTIYHQIALPTFLMLASVKGGPVWVIKASEKMGEREKKKG